MNTTTWTHVGLDVHKETIAVSVRRPGVKDPENWTVGTSAEQVRKLARQLKKRAGDGLVQACYEAGPTGFGLQRLLESEGVACDVIAPSLTPVRPGERRSTDRLDADRLSEHLRAGLLTPIAVPTPEEESARDVVRRTLRAREEKATCRREILSLLLRLGVRHPGSAKAWTKPFLAWLEGLELAEAAHQVVLEDCLRELRHREERCERLMRHVEELAAKPMLAAKVGALRCLKGIDTFSAMVLATEIVSPERFPSAGHLMGFVGLVVAESSSGQTQRRLGLTKTGNVRARRILVESAHHARFGVVREGKGLKARRAGQPEWAVEIAQRAERRLHDKYWALVRGGKPECKAIGAVARELAGFAWAILVEASRRAPAPKVDEHGALVN